MNLREEFKSSFRAYVPEQDDIRRCILVSMLEQTPEQIIYLVEPHDLAALLTCAMSVDPRAATARDLLVDFSRWQEQCRQAEIDDEDPGTVFFDPQVEDILIQFDASLPGLETFLRIVPVVDGGSVFFAKILVCLMWAHRIPEMIPNLWSDR